VPFHPPRDNAPAEDRERCVKCSATAEDCRNKLQHDHKKCCPGCNHPRTDNKKS
jgi:hypothetical protein